MLAERRRTCHLSAACHTLEVVAANGVEEVVEVIRGMVETIELPEQAGCRWLLCSVFYHSLATQGPFC